MKGCVQKKGKFYYAVVAIGPKRKWFQGGQAKKDAQKVLTDKIHEIQQGTYQEIPKIRFAEFARDWLRSYAEVNVKPSTLARYRDIIERLLIPVQGVKSTLDSWKLSFRQIGTPHPGTGNDLEYG